MSDSELLISINHYLESIANSLELLANKDLKTKGPNYRYTLAEYWTFDWSSIKAEVIERDNDGPTRVRQNGDIYFRRAPSNKFDPAIWYSRASGHDEDGGALYLTLITFRDYKNEAEALPDKVRNAMEKNVKAPAPTPMVQQPTTGMAPAIPPVHIGTPVPDTSNLSLGGPGTRTTTPQPAAVNPAPAMQMDPAVRPPHVVKNVIEGDAAEYINKPISDGKANLLAPVLESCFAGTLSLSQTKAARQVVQHYLTGYTHLSEMPSNFKIALYKWLAPMETTDEHGKKIWLPAESAKFEARNIFLNHELKE